MANGDPKQEDVRLEVRTREEMTLGELDLLELAGLDEYDNAQAWTALGTNIQLSYCTHGAFRYFGKFPPPIATYLIQEYATGEDDYVYDLMAGSGTTGVECLLSGRKCLLNDVNPLSILLSKVKTTYLKRSDMQSALQEVIDNYRPLTLDEYAFVPVGLRNPDHYFLPETSDSLRGIRKAILDIEDDDLRDFLMVAFLACIRRVSRATTQQGRLFLDVATAEKEALPFFEKRAEILINGIGNLPSDGLRPEITSLNLMEPLPSELKNGASLIILHPPYFNSYKYSSINSLELGWLDEERRLFNKKEVREFFKVGKAENYKKYVDDMVSVIVNSLEGLRDGSTLALMIGDTRIKGEYIQVTKTILDRLQEFVRVDAVALRVPKYTEASWAASQRRVSDKVGIALCDFVIILRKK